MNTLYSHIRTTLCASGIEAGEARAVSLLLLEKVCGLTVAEALIAETGSNTKEEDIVVKMAERIAAGEPVQYVLGEADFCGLSLCVKPGVLIPRPETQELVKWVADDGDTRNTKGMAQQNILDICTGSGCIAIALAKHFPDAKVEAWDVSEEALNIAKTNAEKCGVNVKLKKVDVLNYIQHKQTNAPTPPYPQHTATWDVIVSNPPYVCEKEATDIAPHVLKHEPHLALFVPDDDPLIFYRQIAQIGITSLRDCGRLYFEINRLFGKEITQMLHDIGYTDIELRQDFYGNDRMVKAIKRQKNRYYT